MPPTNLSISTVTIERIVAGGYGLAHLDGRVVLVRLTAPGDTVEVELPPIGPMARLVRVVEPGLGRVTPGCHHYGECGGCDLMHLSYSAQTLTKLELITDAMQRIGGRLELPGLAIISNPSPLHSRIRATWRPAGDGTAGYYRRGSKEVVKIDHCPILDPALESKRSALQIDAPILGLTNGTQTSLSVDGGLAPEIELTVAGERLRASANVFFQASMSLLDPFVNYVIHHASRDRPERVLELYAGIGLFTVPLARRVGQIETVESSTIAVSFARDNVNRAGLTNVRVQEATVERWLAKPRLELRPQVVLVDPPRVGLSAQVAERLIAMSPQRLVYVSCDPATFARDAHRLANAGYRIMSGVAFDLFPHTHHVELVARFERTDH